MSSGCGRKLKKGQYWNFCGETDMGQSAPHLCLECGGKWERDTSKTPNLESMEMETVEVDIKDENFLKIAVMAHEKDITFNEMVSILLLDYIDGLEQDEKIK